ncbi:MAG TPA: helix-turn-helix transcriptional regulator [Pseudonocardiaceae bacterium]|nr:helix-turn-helix transcriptional regulator [Pseudonocardiaceae bacterium]
MSGQRPAWALRLRGMREDRKWSQLALAYRVQGEMRRLGMRPVPTRESMLATVKAFERGARLPGADYQYILASVFGLGVPALFGQWARLSALPARSHLMSGSLELPHFAHAEDDPMERRLFVAWLMTLSAGAAVLPEPVKRAIKLMDDDPDVLPAITMDDVTKLDTVHETFMRLGYAVGSMSRKAAVAQLSFAVDQLRAGVPGRTEALDAWKILTARMSDTACKMSLDAGREREGLAFSALGCEVASTIENPATANAASGFFMAKMAEVLAGMGRSNTALDLVHQAQSVARDASPTTLHAMHAIKAEAYGGIGDQRGADRELGMAEEMLGEMSTQDTEREPWAWYYQQASKFYFHKGTAGKNLARVHPERLTAKAVSETYQAFRHPGYIRLSGLYAAVARLRSATVLMLGKEPEEGVRVGREALPMLPALRSKRVRDDALDLAQAAGPHSRRAEVKEFLADLGSTG